MQIKSTMVFLLFKVQLSPKFLLWRNHIETSLMTLQKENKMFP